MKRVKSIFQCPWALGSTALFVAVSSGSAATIIDIAGSVNGDGEDEFADYSALDQSDAITPISSVTDGDYTLAVAGFGDQDGEPLVGWGDNYKGSITYSAGQEIDFQKGGDATDAAGAFSQSMYLEFSLSSSGSPFNWESISVTLWRNGGAAADTYQFAYSSDGTWDTADLLGSATSISGNGATGTTPAELATITYNSADIVTDATDETLRLYFWGGTSAWQGNSHMTNVEARFSQIPEPSTGMLLMAALALGLAVRRR